MKFVNLNPNDPVKMTGELVNAFIYIRADLNYFIGEDKDATLANKQYALSFFNVLFALSAYGVQKIPSDLETVKIDRRRVLEIIPAILESLAPGPDSTLPDVEAITTKLADMAETIQDHTIKAALNFVCEAFQDTGKLDSLVSCKKHMDPSVFTSLLEVLEIATGPDKPRT